MIVSAVRTPFSRAFVGGLAGASEFVLAEGVVAAAIDRAGVAPESIDDILLGEVYQGGGCLARHTALALGLPPDTPGVAVGGFCASGMLAVHLGVAGIRSGMKRAVVAGGVSSFSNSTVSYVMGSDPRSAAPSWAPSHPGASSIPDGELTRIIGEAIAAKFDISRAELDEWALRAHGRAAAAVDNGEFADEIVAVTLPDGQIVDTDDTPLRGLDAEAAAASAPVMGPGGLTTVINQTGLTDGAAAVVMCDDRLVAEQQLTPLAVVTGWANVGAPADESMAAVIVSVRRALAVAGNRLADIDLFEVHDSFAAIGVAFERALELDRDKINVLGGGLALGHPFASSGARVVTTLVHALRRRNLRTGVGVIVGAGGMATAIVLETV